MGADGMGVGERVVSVMIIPVLQAGRGKDERTMKANEMTTVNATFSISYGLSQMAINEIASETGKAPTVIQNVSGNLSDLSPENRRKVIDKGRANFGKYGRYVVSVGGKFDRQPKLTELLELL